MFGRTYLSFFSVDVKCQSGVASSKYGCKMEFIYPSSLLMSKVEWPPANMVAQIKLLISIGEKKLSFNKMLNMTHYAGAMPEIIKR